MRDDQIGLVVGRRLRARRKLLGLTQQALADVCGITFQQIQKYECAACRISVGMLWKLACALEVEIAYFFADLPRPRAVEMREHAAMERLHAVQ